MKHFFYKKKSRWLLLAILAMMVGASPTWADELTVANGATTNSYIPFMGQNADYGIKGEYIIPANSLTNMNGMAIKSIKLYATTNHSSTKPHYGPFQVFLKEVENATPYSSSSSAFQGMEGATVVYEGTIAISSNEMLITFTSDYTYNGGNLLIGFYKDKGGNYLSNSFYGVNQEGYTAISSYSSSGISSISSGTGRMFIPKTTFTYESSSPYKKPATLLYSDVTYNSAVISWTAGSGNDSETGWDLEYKTSDSDTWTEVHGLSASTLSYTLNALTDNKTYEIRVKAIYGENESGWKTTSFKTPMAPITSFPWTENFNSLTTANTIPDGWDNSEGTTTTANYKWCFNTSTSGNGATNGTGHEGKCIRFDSYNNTNNYTNFLKTPVMSYAQNAPMQLKFWYKNPKGGDFSVYISNDGGATYTEELASGLTGASSWTEKVIDLPTDEYYNNVVIVFKGTSNYGSGDAYIYLDDVLVKENASYAMSISGEDVVSNTIAFGEVKNTSTTKTFTISNDGANTLTGVSVVSSNAEVFTVSDTDFDIAAGETKDITVTFVKGVVGNYEETITVSQENVASPIVLSVTGSYATPSVAEMVVKDGEEVVGETVAFGNVGKTKSKTITITNTGEADLNITSITSSNTTDFTVSPSALTVHGSSSETFTVTFVYPNENPVLDTEKTATITVTASNEGIDPVVFAVTGTRIEQWSEDFSGNALPDGWENDNTSGWTFADGVVKGHYAYNTTYYLTTPSLKVEATSDVLSFDYVATGNYVSITIQKSKNGGAWESCSTATSIGSLNNGNAGTATITGLEAGNYKFRFKNDDYNLDNFVGFKRNMNDPKMGIYTDAECTVAATTAETKDFGFATTDQTASYYIKNDGTGTMTLSKGDDPAGFTATLDKTSVAAGEHATLTITMPATENTGYHSGNIVVTATDLGTFTITANGVIRDEDKMYLDFSSTNIPATWTTNNWTKNGAGYIENSTYSSGSVETAILTAEAGEEVVIEAKMFTTSYTLGVNYKKEGDAEWSTLIEAANVGTEWTKLRATIADAGKYQLQFVGTRAQIRRIYGLAELNEPAMVVYDNEEVAGNSYNFGNVSNENDATWTLTVKNEGKAKMTGLAAALSGTNSAHYSVEISGATGEGNDEIEANAQATITVKQLKDNLGSHEATLTISADDPVEDQVITLSGYTYDHNKMFVDFESGSFPTGWTSNSWTVATTSGNKHARAGYTASSLITTPLNVAEDESLIFKAKRQYGNSAPTFQIRYTTNGGVTWSDYADYASQVTSADFTNITLSGINAGTTIVEIYGRYVDIDDIIGFAPTTAPVLSLTESAVAVANGSTKEFGNLMEAGTATYTLSNTGTANLVSTVATTGVATAAISGEGEGVSISENTVTLEPGKSATITLTLPYEAPFGEKSGAMTITTDGWVGDFTVNYTATTVDPTAVNIDFANNSKPEGWYNGGWYFNGTAYNSSQSEEKDLITSLLTVAGTADVLTFDARAYFDGYTESLTVSYSTDRKNWTNVITLGVDDLTSSDKNFEVKGLNAGNYYLKFTGKYVRLDNILGWHNATPAPEHDLYVSASNIPTATKVPETSITATATVYSLRANEEGVYAKLFFNEELVATAEAQDINKDGSVNFELTGNVPATENTYAAKIVVYYSDNSVAFETLTTNVEVAHTRTLAITVFTRDGEGAMEADEQNQISPVFNVTVQNNGTTNYESPTVKVFNGEVEVGTATSNATVAPGESTELTVTATNMSAGEGGELSFTAKAYWDAAEFSYATPVVIEVTAAAPKFALYQDATPVNNGDDVEFGLTRIAKTYSYTIKNEGTAPMELVSIVAPTGFTATAVTNENKDIAVNGTLDIDVTLNAEQGKKSGNLVITYKVDANTNNTFTLALSGRSISEDTWVETFDTEIPASWTNNGWEWNSDRKAAYSTYTKGKELMTPRLAAEKDEELTFDVIFPYNNEQLKVQYSTDKTNWTEVATYNSTASNQTFEGSFIAPATGNYYLKFGDSNSRYVYIDNFVGFKLNIPEHDTEIASSSVPTTGKQYNTYTATVTLKENAGKAEEVTAKLYVGGEVKATKNETITANGSTIVTLTWEPEAVISEAVKAYVAVTGTGIDLTTDQVDLTIAKVYTLDETSAEAITAVSEETILLKRTFAKGWNTVCLPFNIGNVEEFFGEGAKAYSFTSYIDGTLGFTATATISQATPYVVYVPTAINEDMKLNGYSISSLYTEADVVQQGEGYFRGTYAPIAAPGMEGLWGVTTEAKIAKGTDKASMKGFRAYFELPNGVSSARLAFTDEDGTTTVIKAIELDKQNGEIYNLNGQRVENMKKGNLYIINGKKQIRR